MVTCSEEKRKRRRTSWDFGGYFTPFLVSSHSPHPMADQMLGWLVVPKYGIMYENPMKLGRMMNGIQGIPRVTTQGCGFFNGFIWVGPKLLQFCSWRINESNPRCTVTSLKLPSLCWDLKKGVGMGVFFPHPGVLVSLLQVEAPKWQLNWLITWLTRVFFGGITIVFMRWTISPRFT